MAPNPQQEITFSSVCSGKTVKVTLTFPPEQDWEAAECFLSHLKEIYLEKATAMAAPTFHKQEGTILV